MADAWGIRASQEVTADAEIAPSTLALRCVRVVVGSAHAASVFGDKPTATSADVALQAIRHSPNIPPRFRRACVAPYPRAEEERLV